MLAWALPKKFMTLIQLTGSNDDALGCDQSSSKVVSKAANVPYVSVSFNETKTEKGCNCLNIKDLNLHHWQLADFRTP